jgi:NAD-dependent DNA ligase
MSVEDDHQPVRVGPPAVLAGRDAGSKLEKAQTLGVPVVDEAAFRDIIG